MRCWAPGAGCSRRLPGVRWSRRPPGVQAPSSPTPAVLDAGVRCSRRQDAGSSGMSTFAQVKPECCLLPHQRNPCCRVLAQTNQCGAPSSQMWCQTAANAVPIGCKCGAVQSHMRSQRNQKNAVSMPSQRRCSCSRKRGAPSLQMRCPIVANAVARPSQIAV
jgi:hypothetical protein